MNILVFRTGQLGDSLVTIPVLKALKLEYPDARISWLYDFHLGKKYVVSRALLDGSYLVDDFIPYTVGGTSFQKGLAAFSIALLWIKLRLRKFDLVIHLEPEMKTDSRSRRDYLFFRLAGCRKQIQCLSYRNGDRDSRPLPHMEHESTFFLRVLREQGVLSSVPESGLHLLPLTAEDDAVAKRQWSLCSIPDGHTCVALGVGSKMQSKRWPLERFESVLEPLIEEHGVWPVFFGGEEDRVAADQLIRHLESGSNLCGKLTLRESASMMSTCRFYLGNDTGTMHLAVAAGIPCVAVFSARDVPGKWFPYGTGHWIHRVPVKCEGCMLYECVEERLKCLQAITPEAVIESCTGLLERMSDDVPTMVVTTSGVRTGSQDEGDDALI